MVSSTTFALVLQLCAKDSTYVKRAKDIWIHMMRREVTPDEIVYASAIDCCRVERNFAEGEGMVSGPVQSGVLIGVLDKGERYLDP